MAHPSFLPLFEKCSPPCSTWFCFNEFNYKIMLPWNERVHSHPAVSDTERRAACLYREEATSSTMWSIFCRDPSVHLDMPRPWYDIIPDTIQSLDIDKTYCGLDFIMVRIADRRWPTRCWMVVWQNHCNFKCSRYGHLLRCRKGSFDDLLGYGESFAWNATCLQASKKTSLYFILSCSSK